MADEKPTLGNIGKELFSEGYWQRAGERQRATKTWWDLVFMPVGFASVGLYAFGFFQLFWRIHVLVYPSDAGHQRIWSQGSMTLSQFLMIIVPLFGAIPLAFMTSNCLMWLVPWARRASEEKAKGVKWASFEDSQMALFKMGLVLMPITLVCGTIGAVLKAH